MTAFYDLVRVYCTTTGTGGPLTLGGAVTFSGGAKAFRSFSDAGIPDGTVLSWAIEDLALPGREAGSGTYSASAGTITRGTTSSTNAGSPLNLSGQAQLYVTALAADLTNAGNFTSGTLPAARLPAPTATTLGGVQSAASAAHQWVASIDTAGVPHLSQPAASDIAGGAALTAANDTNVTLALGGSPAAALLAPASLTLGWSGTLAAARLNASVVQAVANDVNVTGSISAQTLTLGWTGTLAAARLPDFGAASDLALHAGLYGA